MQNNIEIRIVSELSKTDFRELYSDAGWWRPEYDSDLSFIDCIAKNSFCLVGAFLGGKMIGMGRAVSDGRSDAYIQDVIVLNAFRKRGLGKKIIDAIVERLLANGIDWIGLIAQPGTDKFYESLGFATMKDHLPMIYEGKS